MTEEVSQLTPSEYKIAGDNLDTPEKWSFWINENIPKFDGNVENASILMSALVEGASYMQNQLSSRGIRIIKPDFGILPDPDSDKPEISTTHHGDLIFVKQSFLEEHSKSDLESQMTYTAFGVKVAYRGSVINFFRLAGVEEAHHSKFLHKKGVPHYEKAQSMEQYDARGAEYRALKSLLRYAKKQQMPAETISILERRINQAKNYRSQKREEGLAKQAV